MITDKELKELERLLELKNMDTESCKIKEDAEYFIQNYVYIEDRDAVELAALFSLWDRQKKALQDFITHRLNIVLKARQLGLTWLALAYSVWCIVFMVGYQVVALSKTEDDAKELVRRVEFILNHLPDWLIREDNKLNAGWAGLKWSSTTTDVWIYHVGKEPSRFNSMPAGQNSGRSLTANLLLLDEWAFQQWDREIWASVYPTINRPTGGKVIGLSTAKRGTLFEEIWDYSTTFNKIFLPWYTDPRRTEEWYAQTRKELPHSFKAEYPSTAEEAFECAEGLLFPISELKRFKLAELKGQPDAAINYVDTADKGADYLCSPLGKKYGDKVYIVDVVYTQDGVEVTEPLVAEQIISNKVDICKIESNNGGSSYARNIRNLIKGKSKCSVVDEHTSANKETRILMKSGYIKENFYFREDYEPGSMYDKYMRDFCSYMKAGKNKHDDAPDGTTGLAEYIELNIVIHRPKPKPKGYYTPGELEDMGYKDNQYKIRKVN